MLESLTIRHIALIDDVTIHFHDRMQVLTGETGAGKSIVVDSVNLILGGRSDRDLIRSGCDKASVEAVFITDGNDNVQSFMDQESIDYDGRTVTIYREIAHNGKNICRICGVLLPLSKLKELSSLLLDIHGQNDHQFLTDPEKHLDYLDQSGDDNHQKLLYKIADDQKAFIENHRAYAILVRQNDNRESRLQSLEHDLEELKNAQIEPGETERLMKLRKELTENEKTAELLSEINHHIIGEGNEVSCLSRVRSASEALKLISSKNNQFQELSNRCESLYLELEDIIYQISILSDQEEYNPEILGQTDSRLDLIHRLERKYQTDAEHFPDMIKNMEDELSYLSGLESQILHMSAEHKRLLGLYRATARELTESRKKIAAGFENKMVHELHDLGMENARFQVIFLQNNTGKPLMPSPKGDDRIEFMFSPNPGEPLKPLAKIASGGELSRLMLAIKTLESSHTGVESMVFDEIDTGISGRMAQVVAEKMISISRIRQVICVSHLPQIAAASDYHFLVQKNVSKEGRTLTTVSELDRNGRIAEVSRMISGADGITEESDAYAHQMLRAAEDLKKQ